MEYNLKLYIELLNKLNLLLTKLPSDQKKIFLQTIIETVDEYLSYQDDGTFYI